MPVIKSYQRQVSQDTTNKFQRARGDDFGQTEARAAQGLGQAVAGLGGAVAGFGNVLKKREEQKDISDLSTKMSETNARLSTEFSETMRTATPGDDTIIDTFGKHVDDTMSKLRENVTTSAGARYFDETKAKVKGHYFKKAFDGQTHLEGVKAQEDYTKTLKANSRTVLKDPASFEMVRGLQQEANQKAFDNKLVSASQMSKLQLEGDANLASSAVRGYMDSDPGYAKSLIKDKVFDKYLSEAEKKGLIREADQAIRGQEIEAARREKEFEKIKKQKQTLTQNDLLEKSIEGSLTSDDILKSNLDPFGSGSKDQMLKMLETSVERELKTDRSVYLDTFRKIHLPDDHPDKLTDENQLNDLVLKGVLDIPDLSFFRKEIQGSKTAEGKANKTAYNTLTQQVAKSKIAKPDKLTGLPSPHGAEAYQAWLVDFQRTFADQKAKGVPAYKLLSPAYPEYLGKNINEYSASAGKRLSRSAELTVPKPTDLNDDRSRISGESTSDFLKRIKGNR